ncbi:hypothetical protein D3C73_1338630 [compost metagenome]
MPLLGAGNGCGKLCYSGLIDFLDSAADRCQRLRVALMQYADLFFAGVILCCLNGQLAVLALQLGPGRGVRRGCGQFEGGLD